MNPTKRARDLAKLAAPDSGGTPHERASAALELAAHIAAHGLTFSGEPSPTARTPQSPPPRRDPIRYYTPDRPPKQPPKPPERKLVYCEGVPYWFSEDEQVARVAVSEPFYHSPAPAAVDPQGRPVRTAAFYPTAAAGPAHCMKCGKLVAAGERTMRRAQYGVIQYAHPACYDQGGIE